MATAAIMVLYCNHVMDLLWLGTERAVEVRGLCTKKNKLNPYDKIVLRDHSLETIQLAK